jgi:hypothetical protein
MDSVTTSIQFAIVSGFENFVKIFLVIRVRAYISVLTDIGMACEWLYSTVYRQRRREHMCRTGQA